MIYDAFQKKAIDYIDQGHSVIVSAPTGAGKTVIAEHVIKDCLKNNKKVIYTSPIKALSNQKYRDFKDEYGEHVGILTGDVTINPDASTLIMTTEIFRNKILEERSNLHEYSWIIFDEIHYLDDFDRGSVWEESLIFLPRHMNILGLSATIPNIDELVHWLEALHKRPFKIVKEHKRPVPLHIHFQCQGDIYDDFSSLVKHGFKTPEVQEFKEKRIPKSVHLKPNTPISLISHIEEKKLFPCIYFVFSRRRTEYLAEEMKIFNFLDPIESKKIIDTYDQLCKRFDLTSEVSAAKLKPFIRRGIAYHHAGMLPTLKEVVERLFTSRLIKVIFTTETFSLGINMPAKTVVLDELSKFYGYGFSLLKTRDFFQMAGRAGRRSIDIEGHAFCRINPHYIIPRELKRVVYGDTERVNSQFNASYATLLNLYIKYQEKLYDIYPLSLHHFQEKKSSRKRAVFQLKDKVYFLKNMGYIQNKKLTRKGEFASNVYGYELMFSEIYACGLLEQLSWQDLGILTLAIIFEPRKGTKKPKLSKNVKSLHIFVDDIASAIHRKEKRHNIQTLTKRPFFHLTLTLEGWLRGEDFEQILTYTSADEGEVVRYFRMTIQVLRDVREGEVSPQLKDKIYKLIDKINRDVIDSEKQLRS